MALILPTPSDSDDVWGTELNTAITGVNAAASAAATAAASAAKITATDVSGNPILTASSGQYAVLLASAMGAVNGIATLDSGGRIPIGQMGNLTYQSVGAAAAQHQHGLADLPEAAKAINASPAIGIFNTTTNTWPARSSLTTSSSRTVIWYGNATLPADAVANVDLLFSATTTGTTIPDPPSDPTNGGTSPTGVVMVAPTVNVSGNAYNITAHLTNGTTATTFANIQLAVRGPSGTAQDTGFLSAVSLASGGVQALSGSGTASTTGTWSCWIAYNITGGADQASWIDGPVTTFTVASTGGVPPTSGGKALPVLGLSGLPWNSGVCDFSDGDITQAGKFATWRNRPLDAIMYFPGRGSTSDMSYLDTGLTSFPGYRVISLPSQPSNYDNSYAAGGSLNTFWTQYGASLKAAGWNDGRTIIRLNWEANLSSWPHNWGAGGGASAYVQAFKNVVNAVKVNAPTVRFTMCMNRGSVLNGVNWKTDIMNPLLGYANGVGLDWYAFAPAQGDQSSFDGAANNDPGGNTIAAYCRTNNLYMSIDEWGACSANVAYGGTGDSAFWIGAMHTWMAANDDVMLLEYYFDVNADGLDQQIYPVDTKPLSSAAYISTSNWGR